MKTRGWLSFAAMCLFLAESSSKPQQIIQAGNTNTTGPVIPIDPFLDEEEFEKDYQSVVCMKYHLKEETLMEFFTKLALLDMDCPISDCNVTLVDIVEAAQVSRFSTEDIANAIAKLNINSNDAYNILLLYNVNASTIEYLLQTFGLTFSDIYNNFVKSLSNPVKTIPDILNKLNVSVGEFTAAQLYGNDTVRLQVLATGNYSQKNLNDILNITEKTGLDMLKLIPLNVTVRQIRNVDPHEFGNLIKNLGVTSYDLRGFYHHLNTTVVNFLTYPPFIQIVTGVYDFLNSEEVLGTIISKTKVVTSNKAKVLFSYRNQNTQLIRDYAKFYVELVENPLIQYTVRNISFLNPEYQSGDIAIVEASTAFTVNGSEASKVYNTSMLSNCTYVSKLPFGGVYTENVGQVSMNNYTVTMPKSTDTIYNLGSPLFCQDKLYGIATKDGTRYITFSTLQKSIPTVTTKPGGQLPGDTSNAVTGPTVGTRPGGNFGTIVSSSAMCMLIVLLAMILQ